MMVAGNEEQRVTMGRDLILDKVLAELLAVRSELFELPSSAFERRAVLQGRLTELRALAADVRTPSPTDLEALRVQLGRLETELERRLGNRLSHSTAAQTGRGGGIDPKYAHTLNGQIDKGLGVAELKAEIHKIRTLLSNN